MYYMYIFSRECRKKAKNKIVNGLYDLYLKYKDDRYSDDLIVFLIKSLHMHHPVYCMGAVCFGPKIQAIFTYITVILVLIAFIYLNGCFLSALEYKINKQDVTIADPIIMLFRDDITLENRIFYSISTIGLYLFFALVVLICRFYPFERIYL